ncbi:FAD/NAD(P)-binding domain-containing protein [Colletotrichum zoysiae]|uniref:FAD/NAD(P)-binding domain-containing protein n=1 Tax=Colletotrichum zoysiae TaxID=1216348 RepID=A0AAD9H9L0_9PEZI|nr:FAD/NAD(P)-binding domain-containing protein [Colletotrichum zoysiae]
MSLKILVSGAGVAGPAFSALLLGANLSASITVAERSQALRKGGQQIDIRGQGIPVMQKMGLLEAARARAVAEDGIAFIDARSGRQWAMFGKNDSGKGRQAFSSEYEIMRGDLVDLLYCASLERGREARNRGNGGLRYVFGTYVVGIRQFEDGVEVTFSDGTTERFDLVVGADGQSSMTRRLAFGHEESNAAFKSLGVNQAYFAIPREQTDNGTAQACLTTKRRFMATRGGQRPTAQGYLSVFSDSAEWKGSTRRSVSEQKELWAQTFKGAGWQEERLVREMFNAEDFYAHRIGQVTMKNWSRGRVVLLGDAGYCPSPITGMGTACGLVGAYVLAGEIARHGHGSGLHAALKSYGQVLRPFIAAAQKLPPGGPGLMYKQTQFGVGVMNRILGTLSALRVDRMMNRLFSEDKGGWELPTYPELKLVD